MTELLAQPWLVNFKQINSQAKMLARLKLAAWHDLIEKISVVVQTPIQVKS